MRAYLDALSTGRAAIYVTAGAIVLVLVVTALVPLVRRQRRAARRFRHYSDRVWR